MRIIENLRDQYPKTLPVILESKTIDLTRNKFLVPNDVTITKFLIEIRKHMFSISSETAVYLITSDNTVVSSTDEMSLVYSRHKEECGFLFLHVEKENVFG
uniref:Ubiquitin-like protein n=1 Tax=Marseillevirus LCMAC101 TaxID=2506602 RepID=A0A481YU40_9VIRU|nr:MAG: ubiquitin-like protein [Marseillevirus LCMAC101]